MTDESDLATVDRDLYPLCTGGWNLHADPVCWHCADCCAEEPARCIYVEIALKESETLI